MRDTYKVCRSAEERGDSALSKLLGAQVNVAFYPALRLIKADVPSASLLTRRGREGKMRRENGGERQTLRKP